MSRNRYCPTRFPAFIFNPSGADTALQAPLFTWYVGVREKIAAERYRANDDFTAPLSDERVAKAAARAPHVFGLTPDFTRFPQATKT